MLLLDQIEYDLMARLGRTTGDSKSLHPFRGARDGQCAEPLGSVLQLYF